MDTESLGLNDRVGRQVGCQRKGDVKDGAQDPGWVTGWVDGGVIHGERGLGRSQVSRAGSS